MRTGLLLALHQIADQRLAASGVFVSLAPRSSELTKVFQQEVSVLLRPMGRNGWRGTHNQLPKPTEKTTLLLSLGNSVALRAAERPRWGDTEAANLLGRFTPQRGAWF